MTDAATDVALAAVLDALTGVEGQLDAISQSNARIEAANRDILHRLDTIDAVQTSAGDLTSVLEMILGRLIDDRELNRAGFATAAELAAFAHAAAMGNRAALPVAVADDPLLERYMLTQPADSVSHDRALVDWRAAVGSVQTNALSALLIEQYQPSPTDTAESRVLRYRLAAITRTELEGRGAALPVLPKSTVATDRSSEAQQRRSEDLARLWRAGASTALLADAELARAADVFTEAERRAGTVSEEQLSAELAILHREIGNRLEAGERALEQGNGPAFGDDPLSIVPDKQR